MAIGNAVASAATGAATNGLMSSLSQLFSGENGLMSILGSEGFKNLLEGGMGLWQGMQTSDMLDFQKQLATKADARNDKLFNRDMEKDENASSAFDGIQLNS